MTERRLTTQHGSLFLRPFRGLWRFACNKVCGFNSRPSRPPTDVDHGRSEASARDAAGELRRPFNDFNGACVDCGENEDNCRCDDEDFYPDDLDCTHCCGEGTCDDNCDPLWYDEIHLCHACNGSGRRRDQVIF